MPKLQDGEKIKVKLNQEAMAILWKPAIRIKQQEQTEAKDAS